MKFNTLIMSCLFLLCIVEISESSSYNTGLIVGILKNRFERRLIKQKKYEELNYATCVEPNSSHNPFKIIIEKDPTKCYDEDKKPQINPITICFMIFSLILFIFISINDPDITDFLIGMLVADIIESIFDGN